MSELTIMPLELRQAGEGRVLEGLCVPYDRVTLKAGYPRGERFAQGAFATSVGPGVKVRLIDEDHAAAHGVKRRPVGVATELREDRAGLWGTFRFYDTPEGRGAWENVKEETYGGLSVGFQAIQDRRDSAGVREVTRAILHHVSLVDEPAYDQAKIVAVRSAHPEIAELLAVQWNYGDFPDTIDFATVFMPDRLP